MIKNKYIYSIGVQRIISVHPAIILMLNTLLLSCILSCSDAPKERGIDSTFIVAPVDTSTLPTRMLRFAKTLKGTPYKYGSTNPRVGFDCSGFITYVFNHFKIEVPRSSAGFTNEGKPVSLAEAQPGDLILFTGTDSTIRTVGHMGIITKVGDSVVFIHSTSGKAFGVTETTLDHYYMGRFVKVIRYL
ncbi:C40 family peptidase [Chitinophaga sancti]|uniref:C40 family peptidase n=1 Tax=Chitinophaga sancti TaxID=1004 RepID=A0A1K1SV23_9BACT|nr:C40 family peptidase [Chitinophaga sancti]WQD63800.1 C40 family peptidase [Chitinophaga sancti]WQG90575.1 C40 family peptidase [Chitinophaga sancti]SFW88142.1 NlpC/P60 family protein [Chitinophaga sancti]